MDDDGDGGHDYVLTQFDVDLDEDATSTVTVIAALFDEADHVVDAEQISYTVTGQQEGYALLDLKPNPNVEGTYYVHLALSDGSDELYIDNCTITLNPGGSQWHISPTSWYSRRLTS